MNSRINLGQCHKSTNKEDLKKYKIFFTNNQRQKAKS